MITGKVDNGEARLAVVVIGKKSRDVEVVVDTGFTAFISLPLELILELGLEWSSIGRSTLADGSECVFDEYLAEIEWFGVREKIVVDEADTSPLLGMSLLNGCELKLQVCQGGEVSIRKLW